MTNAFEQHETVGREYGCTNGTDNVEHQNGSAEAGIPYGRKNELLLLRFHFIKNTLTATAGAND
jgi:hypothetical protein